MTQREIAKEENQAIRQADLAIKVPNQKIRQAGMHSVDI